MAIPSGLGVAVPWQSESVVPISEVVSAIKPKWFYNYLSNHVGTPGYVPCMWRPVPGTPEWNAAVLDAKTTGRFYLLFNEPEYASQSNTSPEDAATICNQWQAATRRQINGQWKVTQWGGLGLLVNNEGIDRSLQYATDYLNAGGKVPPVWHIHIYAHSGDHWDELWRRWANWIYDNRDRWPGLQRPVVVTEFASWDSAATKQIEVMNRAVSIMNTWTLLHGVCWFSSIYGNIQSDWKRSDAFSALGNLTAVGEELKRINE